MGVGRAERKKARVEGAEKELARPDGEVASGMILSRSKGGL